MCILPFLNAAQQALIAKGQVMSAWTELVVHDVEIHLARVHPSLHAGAHSVLEASTLLDLHLAGSSFASKHIDVGIELPAELQQLT